VEQVLTLYGGCGILVLRLGGVRWVPVVGSPGCLSWLSEVAVMVCSPARFGSVACAQFGRLAPVVPGVAVPWWVASKVPPRGVRVRWGVVLGGAAASWRPGLVLSCLDVDVLCDGPCEAVAQGFNAWEVGDMFCGPAPVVVSFWVLPSGAAVVYSVYTLTPPCVPAAF